LAVEAVDVAEDSMVLFFEAAGLELLWLLLVVAVVVDKDGEDEEFLEFDFSMLVSSLFFVEVGEKNDIKDIFLTHGSLVYPVGLGNQCYLWSIVAWLCLWVSFLGPQMSQNFKKRNSSAILKEERKGEFALKLLISTDCHMQIFVLNHGKYRIQAQPIIRKTLSGYTERSLYDESS
jgi:hypothetical protein